MPAGVEDLLSFVQATARSIIHDKILLFQADPTFFCYWVEGCCPFQYLPVQVVVNLVVFQVPDVDAESGLLST